MAQLDAGLVQVEALVSQLPAREVLGLSERAFLRAVRQTEAEPTLPSAGPGPGRGAFWSLQSLLALRVVYALAAFGIPFERVTSIPALFDDLAEEGLVGPLLRRCTIFFELKDGEIGDRFLVSTDANDTFARLDPGAIKVAVPLGPIYDDLILAFDAAVRRYAKTPMVLTKADFDAAATIKTNMVPASNARRAERARPLTKTSNVLGTRSRKWRAQLEQHRSEVIRDGNPTQTSHARKAPA